MEIFNCKIFSIICDILEALTVNCHYVILISTSLKLNKESSHKGRDIIKTVKYTKDILELLQNSFSENRLISMGISGHKKGASKDIQSVKIKPVIIGDKKMLQFEKKMADNKALHINLSIEEALNQIEALIKSTFYQINITIAGYDYQIFASKKAHGDLSVRAIVKSNDKDAPASFEHNKKKNYILDPEKSYNFLIKLKISDSSGKIIPKRMSKFRQLNRYLEFIRDILPELKKASQNNSRTLRIVDFGCGKAYLTFALYYYLVEMEGLNAQIIGLDLKSDVIEDLKRINNDIGFEGLRFEVGDIKHYEDYDQNPPSMVISLHACDTATDASIIKAVRWGSPIILAVPCCQHEINGIIKADKLPEILKYGLFKERFSTLLTDSLRGLALESMGYSVQMLEFIDMDHTPKNVLLRAVKTQDPWGSPKESYQNLKSQFGIESLYLDKIYD